MKLQIHGLMVFFLLFTLWGCSSNNSVPETRYYVLQATPTGAPATSGEGLELGVEIFRVDAPYDREEVVYRVGRDALEVGFYAYHRWASPVGKLVSQAVAEAANGFGGVAQAEPRSALGEYDAVLRGRVMRIEELDVPDEQLAIVELAVELVVEGDVVWHGRVGGESGGQRETVGEVMQGMNQALQEAVDALRLELEPALAELDS